MQPLVNRQLFTQRVFDSGSLGVLASVIHQFQQPGRYEATVFRLGVPVATFSFVVDEKSEAHQLSIDLAGIDGSKKDKEDCCGKKAETRVVSCKGYVLFYASRGTGYSVRVGTADEKEPAFDSQRLSKNDLFAMSLLDPAKYSIVDRIGGAKGGITVGFSAEDAKRLKSLDPAYVEARGSALEPADTRLVSTQGLVFRIHQSSRIVVERQGPTPKERRPVFQWRSGAIPEKDTPIQSEQARPAGRRTKAEKRSTSRH